ncbi:MAG: AMP-binding protein, partial [Armatimonadetes bacterium]|nr:AMP-binding protein [Anaerolineae bacterium]
MTDENFNIVTNEWFYPSKRSARSAIIPDYEAQYAEAMRDPLAFWAERAETLTWVKRWDSVLDESNPPFYRWFVGGQTNIVLNALDRHQATARKTKIALIFEGEPGDRRTISYGELNAEVCKFANVLRGMGVKKGDTVTVYMGRVPELMIAMLACAKIGAPHSVVYGGFSDQALADRINDAKSKVLVTCDGAWLRGKIIPLKQTVDSALSKSDYVEQVIVYKRTGQPIAWVDGRDHWWHTVMATAQPHAETEIMDANDPLFILYTSGSTGKPKGILHAHGGYQVYTSTTLSWVFDLNDSDRYWCAADPGWITGHSYIVYAPLMLGVTSL